MLSHVTSLDVNRQASLISSVRRVGAGVGSVQLCTNVEGYEIHNCHTQTTYLLSINIIAREANWNCMLGTDAMGKYGICILFYFDFNDYFMVDFHLFQ